MIEHSWTTEAGLPAKAIIVMDGARKRHRCGYVGVPSGHPFHSKSCSEQLDLIRRESVDGAVLGKKSPILVVTATCGSDGEGVIRRSLDVACDVHGGLTYAGQLKAEYDTNNLWWFGFDCAHLDDAEIELDPRHSRSFREGEVRTLEYVVSECESLARQIVDLATQS